MQHTTQPSTEIPPDLIRPGAAAKLLGIHLATLYRWMEDGDLPFYRLGPKQRRVSRRDVEAMVRPERRPLKNRRPRQLPNWEREAMRRRTEEGLKRYGIV